MWPIKNFQKYFMAHQYMLKIFHDPQKNPPVPPPTYLMYGPLLQFIYQKDQIQKYISSNTIKTTPCTVLNLLIPLHVLFFTGFRAQWRLEFVKIRQRLLSQYKLFHATILFPYHLKTSEIF